MRRYFLSNAKCSICFAPCQLSRQGQVCQCPGSLHVSAVSKNIANEPAMPLGSSFLNSLNSLGSFKNFASYKKTDVLLPGPLRATATTCTKVEIVQIVSNRSRVMVPACAATISNADKSMGLAPRVGDMLPHRPCRSSVVCLDKGPFEITEPAPPAPTFS